MQKKLKIILGVLLVIFSLGFFPSGARAQTVPDSTATHPYPVVSKRNPWAAFGLSCLLPGLGQIYNHEKTKGIIFMGLFLPSALCNGWIHSEHQSPGKELTDTETVIDLSTFVISYGVGIWSLIDAPLSAKRINRLNGYGLSKSPSLQLGVYPSPRDPKKCQVGLVLTKGF